MTAAPLIVYTTDTCGYCHALIEWLDAEKIPYVEKPAHESMIPILAVPTTQIGDIYIEGFDRTAIKKHLGDAAQAN